MTAYRRFAQNKLELFTGIPVQNQRILLLNNEQDTDPVQILDDDFRQLGYYSIRDWQVLKVCPRTLSVPTESWLTRQPQVVDTNPSTSFTGQLTDTSQVEKFELSEEAYAQRQGAL